MQGHCESKASEQKQVFLCKNDVKKCCNSMVEQATSQSILAKCYSIRFIEKNYLPLSKYIFS